MRQRRLKNEINVVPYIDVMLVLLVIFMVTAPMIQLGNIDLPTVGELPAPKAEAMMVILRKDGSVALKASGGATEQTMNQRTLIAELQRAVTQRPDQSVVIAADKSLPYSKVTDMLDELRRSGIRHVGLQTESSPR
jgi:biopolymer transport protein TolR